MVMIVQPPFIFKNEYQLYTEDPLALYSAIAAICSAVFLQSNTFVILRSLKGNFTFKHKWYIQCVFFVYLNRRRKLLSNSTNFCFRRTVCYSAFNVRSYWFCKWCDIDTCIWCVLWKSGGNGSTSKHTIWLVHYFIYWCSYIYWTSFTYHRFADRISWIISIDS